ncbi:MAG: hypothetical protein ACLGIR_12455 [Actinomycetes bacterium]
MGEVAYTHRSVVTRHEGPLRSAVVPGREEPVTFGVHGDIAEHYRVDPERYAPDTTTIDYVIAAAGG